MILVLLGPQESGKGTQAERLAGVLAARHVAMGDLVRSEIAAGTALGRRIEESLMIRHAEIVSLAFVQRRRRCLRIYLHPAHRA